MECRWTTRWLNHSAGGNWAENVASATGGADKPLCLRPLLLNKRDNSDIFSEIQEAKRGNQIAWQTHNFCRVKQGLQQFRDKPFCIFIPTLFFPSFLSISSSPIYLLTSFPLHYFQSFSSVHLITIISPSFNSVPFYKTTHNLHFVSFRWHTFKHSDHLCEHFHGKYVWKTATANQPTN